MEKLFADVPLVNQDIWDRDPERAKAEALDAISSGGFATGNISGRVGDYEGQVMAARNGWVEKDGWLWVINDEGLEALRAAGREVPHFLPAMDAWHNSKFEYCVYETTYNGSPAIKLFEKAFPKGNCGGTQPILRHKDVVSLHKALGNWLKAHKKEIFYSTFIGPQ